MKRSTLIGKVLLFMAFVCTGKNLISYAEQQSIRWYLSLIPASALTILVEILSTNGKE